MDTKELFKVDFRDLDEGELTRSWELDDTFFGALDEQEIEHGRLTAKEGCRLPTRNPRHRKRGDSV